MNHFRMEWNAPIGAEIQITAWALVGAVMDSKTCTM